MLEEMDRPRKRGMLTRDVGSFVRVLGMVVAYAEKGTSLEVELRKSRAKVAALEEKLVTTNAVNKVSTKCLAKMNEKRNTLLFEKKSLEDTIAGMRAEMAHAEHKIVYKV